MLHLSKTIFCLYSVVVSSRFIIHYHVHDVPVDYVDDYYKDVSWIAWHFGILSIYYIPDFLYAFLFCIRTET